MFFLRGTRTARIKKYLIHDRQCVHCNDFNLTVKIYKEYFHVWFIPIVASGVKSTKIECNSCGMSMRSDSLAKEYESKTRAPFYLYSGLIFAGLLILGAVGLSLGGSYQRSVYIANPQVGDVYLIKTDKPFKDSYHFSRVMRVNGDSIIAWDNKLNYLSLGGTPSKLDSGDHFSSDNELVYTKGLLRVMYDKDSIVTVFRGEGDGTGFNRVN
ncbi:MAG: hypothetical protein BGO55_08055 [Sphingobacteriales bacterium 50-39]|mgnify:CR=1 FL=1|nr:hypothetical protein [Sphingobacteriales bacterium]OJW53189.1 MAG: hypothetical protein BGO55_08055 [Sphingobacteriales bacterium 50-39]